MKTRLLLKRLVGIALFLGSSLCVDAKPQIPWYNSDAGDSFTDALPIGNGYMGGLIYGGVKKDMTEGKIDLQLNPSSNEEYTVSLIGIDGKILSAITTDGAKHLRFGDYTSLPTGAYCVVMKRGTAKEEIKVVVK